MTPAAPEESATEAFGVHELFTAQDVLLLLLFLAVIWLAGKAAGAARLPALVGEVIAGALCGPPLGDWVPQPAAVALIGQLGLVLLVVESGLEVETAMLRTVGTRGLAIALAGSLGGPLLIGLGLSRAVGLSVTEGLAVGSSLSPTSMGVAVVLFKQFRVLNTPTAQTVLSAAVLDDIVGLVLLSELQALASPSPAAFVYPVVAAVGFLVGVGGAALFVVPPLLSRLLLPRLPPAHAQPAVALLLFGTVVGLMAALSAGRASYLLGAFLGGLSFSSLGSLKALWTQQVKRAQTWLLRIFFAATVGFLIPLRHLWTRTVWAHGALFTLCTLGKLATGALAPRPLDATAALTIGAAMSARGEFAFLVANTAFSAGILSTQTHAAVMLAILLSLVGAPAALRAVLVAQARRAEAQLADAAAAGACDDGADAGTTPTSGGGGGSRVYYRLSMRVAERWGLLPDVLTSLAGAGCEVLECRVGAQAGGTLQLLEAFLRDRQPLLGGDAVRLRLRQLRSALAALTRHDADADDGGGGEPDGCDDDDGGGGGDVQAVDYSRLRGLRLTRWRPASRGAEDAGGALGQLLEEAAAEEEAAARAAEAAAAASAPRSDAALADGLLAAAAAAAAAAREAAAEDADGAGLVGRLRRVPVAGSGGYLVRAPSVSLRLLAARTASATARGSFGPAGGANAEFARALAAFRQQQQRTAPDSPA